MNMMFIEMLIYKILTNRDVQVQVYCLLVLKVKQLNICVGMVLAVSLSASHAFSWIRALATPKGVPLNYIQPFIDFFLHKWKDKGK